jgi:hypothetical protein
MQTWIAQIKNPETDKVECLGRYPTERQALRARVKAEEKYHKEFAANLKT